MAVTAAGETPRSSATRRFVAVLSLLALAVTRLALPGSAEAAFPGANGKIAFASNRDGDYEIYKMNSDGSGVTKLTNDPASDNSPAWSPGGDRIVFERDFCSTCFGGEIWVMNADGTGQMKLLSFVGAPGFEDPAWSPDAQQIAFTRDDHCGGSLTGLNVMNADGTDPHNIVCTGPGGRFNRFRSWSPDGQTIVFTAGLPDSALFAISPDGSGPTQLTTGPGASFGDLSPDWSPDGTKIAFRRAPYSGPVGIYTMNADGTGQVSITSAADDSPAWSPDGTRIAFSKPLCGTTCQSDLYAMNPDGTGQVQITSHPAQDIDPAWQPAGNPAQQADLSLTKSDSPDPVVVGHELTYTVNVSNAGPSPTGATLTDTLPSGVRFISATPPAGETCSESGGTVTCELDSVSAGGSASVTIKVTPQNAGTMITNTASIRGFLPDRNGSNDTATESTSVVPPTADLVVTNTDSPDPVLVGALLTYTVEVHNAGPFAATNVTLTDSLSKHVRLRSLQATQGSCTLRRRTVTCQLGDIPEDASVTVTITLRQTRAGMLASTASASAADPPDPKTANNTATTSTTAQK